MKAATRLMVFLKSMMEVIFWYKVEGEVVCYVKGRGYLVKS
jgi:hypothetical protein